MSEDLKQFYRDYAEWLKSGASTFHEFFRRDKGMCSNIEYWVESRIGDCDRVWYEAQKLKTEMQEQFMKAGLCSGFPFSDSEDYYKECITSTCHLNVKRREWVLLTVYSFEGGL
ncbi:hypothetical protein JC221_037 [Yersinia phage JC221]|nr:hypothetical protein JC221_037 [Yersinia phage JC221]